MIHILYDLGIALESIDGIFHSNEGKDVHLRPVMKLLSIPDSERISIIESIDLFIFAWSLSLSLNSFSDSIYC